MMVSRKQNLVAKVWKHHHKQLNNARMKKKMKIRMVYVEFVKKTLYHDYNFSTPTKINVPMYASSIPTHYISYLLWINVILATTIFQCPSNLKAPLFISRRRLLNPPELEKLHTFCQFTSRRIYMLLTD